MLVNLVKEVEKINKEYDGLYDLEIKEDGDYVFVLDGCEELYYGGFRFEEVLDRLNEALITDTSDEDAYFDCECPGRWIAYIGG